MSLALDLPVSLVTPSLRVVPAPVSAPPYDDEPGPRPVLHLVALPEPAFELDESAWFDEERTPSAQLPDPAVQVRMLVQACAEVVAGARSLTQLRRALSMELYAELFRRLQGGRARSDGRPDPGAVRSVHVQTRPEGVAEACATLRTGGRVQAVAVRLEGFGGAWVCTELEGL